MIKSVKWFFVVLVIGSLISLSFSKESIPAEKLKLGDAAPQLMLCDSVQLLDLHDAREGYTLLSFWASYDAASREKNAALAHLADKHSQIKMISVSIPSSLNVSVIISNAARVQPLLRELPLIISTFID